jgi:hypothetical protein
MQQCISKVIDPYFLSKYNKKSIAEFTPEEGMELSKYKFHLLLNATAEDEPKPATVANDILNRPLQVYETIESDYASLCKSFEDKLGRELTTADTDMCKCYIFALLKGGSNE